MAAIILASTDITVINHEILNLNENQIKEATKEVIQAIWLGHVKKVEELLQRTPSLLNTEFSASIYKISVAKEWGYNLDEYHFKFPEGKTILDTPKPSAELVESWNLQHLACYKKNLALVILIHRFRPSLFFYSSKYGRSALEVLSKDNSFENQNFLRAWLNSGNLDNYLFHRSSSLNLTYKMTENDNVECIKLIFHRALTNFRVQADQQLILAPILYPVAIANLISSYLSFNDCPRIQENINSSIYCEGHDARIYDNQPLPLLYFAMLHSREDSLRFLVDCGADPDQLIDQDNGLHISRLSLRYAFREELQKKIQSILEECGKGVPGSHSVKLENAIIVKKPLPGKLRGVCQLITGVFFRIGFAIWRRLI